MRHNVKKRRLNNLPRAHRNAVVRNLATSIILHERVKTTEKRAKVAAPVVEKLITIAKTKEPMQAIRQINEVVFDKNASRKLMEVLKDRYKDRSSGYTRITKFKRRDGDNALLVVVELTMDADTKEAPKAEAKEEKAAKAAKAEKEAPKKEEKAEEKPAKAKKETSKKDSK